MLNVRREICVGCGVCARVCPTGAISLDSGKAHIEQAECIDCYRCIQACPRGAIETVGVGFKPARAASPVWELRNSLLRLQTEAQILSRRLRSLEQRRKINRT